MIDETCIKQREERTMKMIGAVIIFVFCVALTLSAEIACFAGLAALVD